MRISFITCRWDFGGVPNFVRSFASELLKRHEVQIIVNGLNVWSSSKYTDLYIGSTPLDMIKALRSSIKLTISRNSDILHVNSLWDLISVVHMPQPKVWSLHGFDFICPTGYIGDFYNGEEVCGNLGEKCAECTGHSHLGEKVRRVIRRKLICKATAYTANSNFTKRAFESYTQRSAMLLPPGVRPEHYTNMGDEEYVLYVGRLSKEKGVDVLIKVMKGLKYACKIVGSGPYEAQLREIAPSNVEFLGPLHPDYTLAAPNPMLRSLYSKASLIVVSSTFPEPFGLVCLEALASEKPVIASRVGGIIDCVNSENGILVQPSNVKELRGAIEKLMEDPKLRRRMGMQGRRRVEREFDIRKQTQKLENLYYSLVNRNP